MSNTVNFIKIRLDQLFANRFQEEASRKFIYFFFACCVILIAITFGHAIGDFGNYYYGSKFFKEGTDPLKFYQSIHFFNNEIKHYETGVFFENYTPIPPFSLIFYWPFTFIQLPLAKLLFNLLGLLFFCISFQRLIKTLKVFSFSFYVLPVIFLMPLHSNFHHGQAYLLIAGLLFEFYIAFQNDKKMLMGLIIAFLFSLKIFPAFIAILFLIKRDWRTIGWIAIFTVILQAITYLFVGAEVMNYYYGDVFLRLASNDITEPFSTFNQNFSTVLLNSFVFHPYLNPSPCVNAIWLAVILQLLFYSFVFCVFVKMLLKQHAFTSFFLCLVVLALFNKYSTVYGLILFFPFIFLLKYFSIKKMVAICLVLFFTCNIPIYKLDALPVVFQYPRVWLLVLLFLLLVNGIRQNFSLKYFIIGLIIFIFPSLIFYKYSTDSIEFRPGTGIVYDFKVTKDHVKLFTCVGNRDTIESVGYVANAIDSNSFRSNNLLNKKAILLNNEELLVMTDENMGVGMYYLKLISPDNTK